MGACNCNCNKDQADSEIVTEDVRHSSDFVPDLVSLPFLLKEHSKKKRKQNNSNSGSIQRVYYEKISIWELCKNITRKRYGNVCYSCEKGSLAGSNWHTGHLFPKSVLSAYLKYDLRVLRPQCYYCNINLGGNGANYLQNLIKKEGQEYVDKINQDKFITVKAIDHYKKILPVYQSIWEEMK